MNLTLANPQNAEELVFKAATNIFTLSGIKPSLKLVHSEVGILNKTVVGRHLKRWERQNERLLEREALSPSCIDTIQDEIDRRVLAAAKALHEELKRVQADYDALLKENEELIAQRDSIAEEIHDVRTRYLETSGQATQLQIELSKSREEVREARQDVEVQRKNTERQIDHHRTIATEAIEKQKKAEAELATIPELKSLSETALRLADALDQSSKREEFFLEKYEELHKRISKGSPDPSSTPMKPIRPDRSGYDGSKKSEAELR
ncbi:MAG TPA: DNA-binding protein [Oligoflexus sp.]|uniref:DNA-binding protein n=1 Tax=Oligoflexus sp. TaxID=1971216 RepID=UPI002D3B76C6|nr:DNA-binding protein [Oligoflexus sp.]HYX32630.1 DNA-binding protein [Oligoflexus sp.]